MSSKKSQVRGKRVSFSDMPKSNLENGIKIVHKKARASRKKVIRHSLQEVLQEGDIVFLKSYPELREVWRNCRFIEGDHEFLTLNSLNTHHYKNVLGKLHPPNAWVVYGLEKLDDIFMLKVRDF